MQVQRIGENRRKSVSSARELLSLSLPVMITSFSVAIMNLTDAIFLGNLGYQELAAIAAPSAILLILVAFGRSFLFSVATFVSQSSGADRPQECGSYAWQGCFMALALGLASSVGLWPLVDTILSPFSQADVVVRELSSKYFRISLFVLPPQMVALALVSYFYGIRKNRSPMVAGVTGIIVNIGLSYSLIFGKFGLPQLGIEGAAWGTVIATILEVAILMLIFLLHKDAALHGNRKPRVNFARQKQLLSVGLPAGIQGAVDDFSWAVGLIWLISVFGTAHLAAATIIFRCMQFTILPADGLATAIVSQVGDAIGAQKYRLADAHARMGFRIIGTYMVTAAVILLLFRRPIMECFTNDHIVIEIGVASLVWIAISQYFDAMNITYIHALHGAGDNLWPTTANLLLSIVVVLLGGLAMIRFFNHLQSQGIWMVACFYLIIQGLLFHYRWKSGAWKWINIFDAG